MYLKQTKTREGRIYLSITEGFRQDGKVKTRTIESCGYLDELEKVYDDPIAHFKQHAEKLTRIAKRARTPIIIEVSPLEKIDKCSQGTLLLGCLPVSRYYHRIGIDTFWNCRRGPADLGFDPNAVFRFLTYARILDPLSKKVTFEHKDSLPDRSDFSFDDIHYALTFFAHHESAFKNHVDAGIARIRPHDMSCVYYDVTNYYFEVEDKNDPGRSGVSKKLRPNPIVQMGLLLDGEGIPIDYEVFAGNVSDPLTLTPVMKKMRARHLDTRMVVVLDEGLNASDNITSTLLAGNGYIFSQSVRKATPELKGWVLETTGYEANESGTFRIKSRQANKDIRIKGKDGRVRVVSVPVKQVAFWSRDFAIRSRVERAQIIEKSRAAIVCGDRASAQACSQVCYVRDTPVVRGSGETAIHTFCIDEDRIVADEAMDGYYCIVTSETDRTNSEIIDIYRGLWRIEETFRVTKSTLKAESVYVSREDRIRAHFMVCYASLVMLRLLQASLRWTHSAQAISDDLSQMTGVLEDRNVYLFSYRTDLTDEIGKVTGLDLTRRRLTRKQVKDMLAATRNP